MTDPKPTTSEEIALLRKWKRAPSNMPEGWIDPNGIELGWVETLPDFEHEWAHAGPLQFEMANALGWVETAKRILYELRKTPDFELYEPEIEAATSRAWLAWKKEEKK